MPDSELKCPGCGVARSVPEHAAGKRATCPKRGTRSSAGPAPGYGPLEARARQVIAAPVAPSPSASVTWRAGEVVFDLYEVAGAVPSRLGATPDKGLMAPPRCPCTGDRVVAQVVYTIRHTLKHARQIDMILRRSGVGRVEPAWR